MQILSFIFILIVASGAVDALKIAAFNIRRLSGNAVKDQSVVNRLVQILSRYDITVVEEVMDHTGLDTVVSALNRHSTPYHAIYSNKIGRTSYKEHYAFVYRTDKVSVRGTYQYPDPNDHFEREPFSAQFHSPSTTLRDFVLIATHIKPSDAPAEINRLPDVYDDVSRHFGNKNAMIAGDFNAECRYLSQSELQHNRLYTDHRFTWLIQSNADTTASHHTNCAYDRFVVAGNEFKAAVVPGSVKVYNFETGLHISFDEAWSTSDHYPIEMEIR